MDFIQVILILGIVAGVILVVISFVGPKGSIEPDKKPQNLFLEKRLETMGATISEADNVIAELNGMSKNVIQEMEKKYDELLFLYNLIDEKKNEISVVAGTEPTSPVLTAANEALNLEAAAVSPRLAQILELKNKGMNMAQIAKELGMGQGEVALIMTLTK